jgi:hypothetical protein
MTRTNPSRGFGLGHLRGRIAVEQDAHGNDLLLAECGARLCLWEDRIERGVCPQSGFAPRRHVRDACLLSIR